MLQAIPTALQNLKWDDNNLIVAIAQDAQTGRVLMVAYMNPEALQQTIQTGYAHYYSRSRQQQWKKGEASGHTQRVLAIRTDCDGDAILLQIQQNGGIACHTGRESCFYKVWKDGAWQTVDTVLKDEEAIYGHKHP